MKYVKCDLCDGENYVVIEAMGRFREPLTNVVCCKCGLVYQNPRMNSDEMRKFYRTDFSGELYSLIPEELMVLMDKHRYTYIHRYIDTHIQKTQLKILEIGSGFGGLLELLRKDGYLVKGIEPSRSLYEASTKRGLDVFHGFLEDFGTEKYDLILAFHVLEHVESPTMFMRKAKTLLKDDGRIIIDTPDIWRLHGDPHRGDDYVFRKDHTFTFSEKTMAILGQRTGLAMNPLPRLASRNILAEFRPCCSSKSIRLEELKDNYVEIVNNVLSYRSNYNWKQRLLNAERLNHMQLIIKRLVGERGLTFIKICLKKIGVFKVIEKIQFRSEGT